MPVGEVCNREVVFVERDTSIMDVAKLMRKHHVGDVVVVDQKNGGRTPVGILTDRDIVVELLAEDVDLDVISAGDAMSFELLTAKEEDDLMETVQQMKSKGVRRIPVVNRQGNLEGILAMDDLIELMAEQLSDLSSLIVNEQGRERNRRG